MATVSWRSSATRAGDMAVAQASHIPKNANSIHLEELPICSLRDVAGSPPRHRNGITYACSRWKACELDNYKATTTYEGCLLLVSISKLHRTAHSCKVKVVMNGELCHEKWPVAISLGTRWLKWKVDISPNHMHPFSNQHPYTSCIDTLR